MKVCKPKFDEESKQQYKRICSGFIHFIKEISFCSQELGQTVLMHCHVFDCIFCVNLWDFKDDIMPRLPNIERVKDKLFSACRRDT